MTNQTKSSRQYLKMKIQTASKEELVLMLMDGVVRFSETGRKAIEAGNREETQTALIRAQDIIMELVNGLDHEHGGEVASNLGRLYAYALRCLVEANMKQDTAKIDEVQGMFRELREAWSGAIRQLKSGEAEVPAELAEKNRASAKSLEETVRVTVNKTPVGDSADKKVIAMPRSLKLSKPVAAAEAGAERPRLSVQG